MPRGLRSQDSCTKHGQTALRRGTNCKGWIFAFVSTVCQPCCSSTSMTFWWNTLQKGNGTSWWIAIVKMLGDFSNVAQKQASLTQRRNYRRIERNHSWSQCEDIDESQDKATALLTYIQPQLIVVSATRVGSNWKDVLLQKLHISFAMIRPMNCKGQSSIAEFRLQLLCWLCGRLNADICTRLQRRSLL